MAQQFQGKLLITVTDAQIVNYNTQILQSITNAFSPNAIMGSGGNVYCVISMEDQVATSKKVPKTNNPHWELMHTFNVYDPFDEVVIFVALEAENGDSRNFGRVSFLLKDHSLVDQKSHELSLTVASLDTKEVVGTIKAHVQYKYRKTWEALYKGTTALQKQEYAAAVALLTHHLNNQSELTSSMHMVYDFRCEAFCGMGKLDEALVDALKVLDLKPGNIAALIRLARVYVLRAQFQEAEKVLFRASTIAPDDARVIQEKQICENEALIYRVSNKVKEAYAHFNKGSYVNAANTFGDALDEVSNSSTIYLYRAISFLAAGAYDSCMDDIMRMLELQPGWPRTENLLEGSLQKRGGVNVMMKRRWFILKHCFLLYYKTSNDVQPQGIICLHKASVATKGKKELTISSENSKRVYEMKADAENERNNWSKVLSEVSSTKLALPEMEDASQLVANSRKIYQVDVVTDIFNKLQDGFFLPTKVATTIGEKIIASFSAFVLEPQDKRGWLYKKGRLTSEGEWARRFFVLKAPYLYYLSPAQDEDLGDGSVFVPRGYISLDKGQINVAPSNTAQAFAFEISPKNSAFLHQNILKYLLSAESQADFDSWVSAIRKITDPPAVEAIPRAMPPPSAEEGRPTTMLGALARSATISHPRSSTISHPPSASSSSNFANITNNSSSNNNFASIPTLDPPPKPTYLKPINYISNYVPPPDAMSTTPAQKHVAPIEDYKSHNTHIDDKDDNKHKNEKEEEEEEENEDKERNVPNSKYSLNNDPPANGSKKAVSGVESRFYKFGVPDPSTSPPRQEYEETPTAGEDAPLLKNNNNSYANEDTQGNPEEEKGCCCTIM